MCSQYWSRWRGPAWIPNRSSIWLANIKYILTKYLQPTIPGMHEVFWFEPVTLRYFDALSMRLPLNVLDILRLIWMTEAADFMTWWRHPIKYSSRLNNAFLSRWVNVSSFPLRGSIKFNILASCRLALAGTDWCSDLRPSCQAVTCNYSVYLLLHKLSFPSPLHEVFMTIVMIIIVAYPSFTF